jgi:hypothetical protein
VRGVIGRLFPEPWGGELPVKTAQMLVDSTPEIIHLTVQASDLFVNLL